MPELKDHVFVIVDKRQLYGDALIAGLQLCDPSSEYRHFLTAGDWLRSEYRSCIAIVAILVGNGEIISKGELAEDRSNDPSIRFIVMGDVDQPKYVLKALELGAAGYIPMSFQPEVVVQALHLVRAGGIFVPASSMQLLALQPPSKGASSNSPGFSPREIAVAKALRKGTPNKIIAYELNMAESTVKAHVRQIMRKLKAKSRAEIAYLTNHLFKIDDDS